MARKNASQKQKQQKQQKQAPAKTASNKTAAPAPAAGAAAKKRVRRRSSDAEEPATQTAAAAAAIAAAKQNKQQQKKQQKKRKRQRRASQDDADATVGAGGGAGGGAGAGAADTTEEEAVEAPAMGVGALALTRSKPRAPVKYINKQRVLILCSRGVTARFRHLMEDVRRLVPHHKKDAKLDSKDNLNAINEIAELKNCNNCIYFEARKRQDLYMWMSKTPNGPSVKFQVLAVHTMDELRMTGNCLKGSRPVLSFSKHFDSAPHLRLLREMVTTSFGTPRGHPKSQPFVDHVLCVSWLDNKIWFRNYQIVDTATDKSAVRRVLKDGDSPVTLVEIGPRFVLQPVRIFSGSFGGATIYQNPDYVSPNTLRHQRRMIMGSRYGARKDAQAARMARDAANPLPEDKFADVFK